jgi:hypothetical protein
MPRTALAVLAAAVGMAGCGGGASTTTTAAAGLPLTQRVIASPRLPRMHADALVRPVSSARQWLAERGLTGADLRREAARLRRLGFVAGARETLVSQRRNVAAVVSIVEELGSPASAREELADESARVRAAATSPGRTLRPFPVAAVPGAVGYEITRKGASTRFLGFSDGRFCYLLTSVAPVGALHAPPRAEVVAALRALYRRVHGKSSI